MNDRINDDTNDLGAASSSDDTVAALMNLAGPRASIPSDLEERVHRNVHEAWRGATRRSITMRWSVPVALAATVLIAIALVSRTPETVLQPVGIVAHTSGIGDASGNLSAGGSVFAGDLLTTGRDGGLSIDLVGDVSLRIAPDSAVRIDGSDAITLSRGMVYADSGERIYRDRHVTVYTLNGSATDVGTQFLVAFDSNEMSVAVREGRVDVTHDQSKLTAEAGQRITMQMDREAVVEAVPAYDSTWDWAMSLAPDFDLENETLLNFLKWAARETGKTLIFSSDEVRMAAMSTELFGSIESFTPIEALTSVLSTTQFIYRIDEQTITIEK
jgi:ferric-dicitrate binding protein FerR (iron transport regulator)